MVDPFEFLDAIQIIWQKLESVGYISEDDLNSWATISDGWTDVRPDSLLRLWCYINHLLTYLHANNSYTALAWLCSAFITRSKKKIDTTKDAQNIPHRYIYKHHRVNILPSLLQMINCFSLTNFVVSHSWDLHCNWQIESFSSPTNLKTATVESWNKVIWFDLNPCWQWSVDAESSQNL